MSLFDYVSLGLASVVVALTMMSEIRDMNIGQMMTLQMIERDRNRRARKPDATPAELGLELGADNLPWRYALGALNFVRRYCILPDVALTCVLMVTRYGGDSVSIMLNTLAALFMLELDNLAFDYGLTSEVKSQVEAVFKVQMGAEQAKLLRTSRRWHVIALTLFFIVMINVLPFLKTVWDRLRACNLVLIGIIAVGESIELAFRWRRRTSIANAQRVAFFAVKVSIMVIYKWWLPSITFLVAAQLPFVLG